MASLNNIKLKNIKKHKTHFSGRIDMDNRAIGYFSFDFRGNMLTNLIVDINYFSKQVMDRVNLENLFSSESDLTEAISKDDENREEFDKRVDMFCRVPDKKYENVFCNPDIRDFIKKLFMLYLSEKDKCKNLKKKTRSKKFDIWMGEAE